MGLFAICTEEDGVDACLSAMRSNLKMYDEDRLKGRDSTYLLHFAQGCLEKAIAAAERENSLLLK